ncbi:MAG: acetyl-CoA carboxylase biotin carboxyl carrier protein [Cyanosarcina radialis HA8281-LM2]|jgi:acetyl-CoA carboxylase biotin carboxyl carrier protein|nr:acetyl-CoA carboxylase biotin carboxyl carrier protein [Cyanosarcina radialis HA8281-LM2]
MAIDFQELRELLAAIATTDITELTLKSADFELTVRQNGPLISSAPALAVSPVLPSTSPAAVPTVPPPPDLDAVVTPTTSPPPVDKKSIEIKSPMVGTYYRSPAPDEPPFVEVGDRIRIGQTVCIIEAMKLMNEIEAEIAGSIVEIMVQNGQPVEYGQILMRINPD